MSARLEIDMGLNASGVAKGAKNAAMALEDLEDTLGDVGRGGSREAEKLEDSLKDVQRQADRTERSVDDIGDTGGKGFARVREGAQEVTQEVGQNLGEAVSSVRGDLSDLGQVGQDTLGGLAATLAGTGPAGIAGAAALAAGAVGLGLITAEIEAQNERVQALKGYFSDAWREAVEGGLDYIDTATVIGEMNDIIFNPDRADEYKQIQEDASDYGLEVSTLLRAAAGDEEALNEVRSRGNALLDERKEKTREAQEEFIPGNEGTIDGLLQEERELEKVNGRWEERSDIFAENKAHADAARQAESEYLMSIAESADSATVEVDALGSQLLTLPDGRQILIEADTGQATQDVDRFEGDVDEVVENLDGSEIQLLVKTAVQEAQSAVNNFITQNDGRSFKLHGRVTVDSGWDS